VRLAHGIFLRYAAPTEPPLSGGAIGLAAPALPSPATTMEKSEIDVLVEQICTESELPSPATTMEKSEIDVLVEQICTESEPSRTGELAQKLVDLLQANRQQVPDASTAARPALLRKP